MTLETSLSKFPKQKYQYLNEVFVSQSLATVYNLFGGQLPTSKSGDLLSRSAEKQPQYINAMSELLNLFDFDVETSESGIIIGPKTRKLITSPEIKTIQDVNTLLPQTNKITHGLTGLDSSAKQDDKILEESLRDLLGHHQHATSVLLYPEAISTTALLQINNTPIYKILLTEGTIDQSLIENDTIRNSSMFHLYLSVLANLGIITGDKYKISVTDLGKSVLKSSVGSVVPDSYHIPVSKTAELARGEITYGDYGDIGRDKLKNGAGSDLQVAAKIGSEQIHMIQTPGKYFSGETLAAMKKTKTFIMLGSGSAINGIKVAAETDKIEKVICLDWSQTQLDLGKRNAQKFGVDDKVDFIQANARDYKSMRNIFMQIKEEQGVGPHIIEMSSFLHDAGSGEYAKSIIEHLQTCCNELGMEFVLLTHENSKTPLHARKATLTGMQTVFEFLHNWSDQDLRVFLEELKTETGEESLEQLLRGDLDRETNIVAIYSSMKAQGIDLRHHNFTVPIGKNTDTYRKNRIMAAGTLATLMKKNTRL